MEGFSLTSLISHFAFKVDENKHLASFFLSQHFVAVFHLMPQNKTITKEGVYFSSWDTTWNVWNWRVCYHILTLCPIPTSCSCPPWDKQEKINENWVTNIHMRNLDGVNSFQFLILKIKTHTQRHSLPRLSLPNSWLYPLLRVSLTLHQSMEASFI